MTDMTWIATCVSNLDLLYKDSKTKFVGDDYDYVINLNTKIGEELSHMLKGRLSVVPMAGQDRVFVEHPDGDIEQVLATVHRHVITSSNTDLVSAARSIAFQIIGPYVRSGFNTLRPFVLATPIDRDMTTGRIIRTAWMSKFAVT